MTATLIKDPIPDFLWVEKLPRLEIIQTKNVSRNCYHEVEYLVRSAAKLNDDDFDWLLSKGYLMSGQMFRVHATYDGSEEYKGRWTVDGKSWVSFYEYPVVCSVDSSD